MIILDATTQTLVLTTSAAVSVDYYVSYVDLTSSAFTPGQSNGNISTATDTTILSAPAASTQRQVKTMTFVNKSTTTAVTITPKHDTSGTQRNLYTSIILRPGATLLYKADGGWDVRDSYGYSVKGVSDLRPTAIWTHQEILGATSIETASYMHFLNTTVSTGTPATWTPGTPGAAGATLVSGTDSGNMFRNITADGFLTDFNPGGYSSTLASLHLVDVLWYGTGYTLTSGSKTVNSVTLPARDEDGSTNGVGCMIALVVTTSTTGTTTGVGDTIIYTNSAGTGSRTATQVNFTGNTWTSSTNAGTVLYFALQSGDTGVKSIESLELSASRGASGAIMLIIYRPIYTTNTVQSSSFGKRRVYNGTWLATMARATGTSVQCSLATTYTQE